MGTNAGGPQIGQPLACEAIVYRVLRKSWLDPQTQELSEAAFILRAGEADGLSVAVAERLSPAEAAAVLTRAAGVASLHCGTVRATDAALDVKEDLEDLNHALITGLPLPEIDKLRAETLAGKLRDQARFISVR